MAAPSFCFRLVSDSLTNPHRPLAPPRLSPQLDARNLIYPAGRGLLRFRIPYFPEFVASSEGNLRTIS